MNEDIIINEDALTEAFIPTRLLHREGQIRELERCLKPALKNRSIENIFLMSTSGTGKTTIARWILENYFKMSSGMLYKEYCTLTKSPVVNRAYRNYMRRMVNLGLVKAEGKGRWKKFELSV